MATLKWPIVIYIPFGSWNTTTALPLFGINSTLSTGPPPYLRLSKYSSMASWVVLFEIPLTTMLVLTGTCSMITLAESKPLSSPLVLILLKSKCYVAIRIRKKMNKNKVRFISASRLKTKLIYSTARATFVRTSFRLYCSFTIVT